MSRVQITSQLWILAIALTFAGCGSKQRLAAERRQAGVAELQRVQSAVHEMDIVVGAGTNQLEFSRRLTDTFLKIGDLEQSEKQVLNDFSQSKQTTVTEIFQHLSQALEAYKDSKDFFGDTHKQELDPFGGDNMFGEQKYEALQQLFPDLENISVAVDYSGIAGGEKQYWKGDMLQALWKAAGGEEAKAKQLTDQLRQE